MVKLTVKAGKRKWKSTRPKDKKGKGSGKKDACYHKVKSRYSVWPSAMAKAWSVSLKRLKLG